MDLPHSTSPPQTKEMNDNFNELVEQERDVRGVAIPINSLLSEFNDSGQLFKSSVFDFWPLCISTILNGKLHRIAR